MPSSSISKFGKKVDTTLAVEGTTTTLNFENGDAGVEFKLVKAFSEKFGGEMRGSKFMLRKELSIIES